MAKLEVLGVHLVEAEETCFLLEVLVTGAEGRFDVGSITQADALLPTADWQVPYAEKLLSPDGDRVIVDLWDAKGDPALWVGDVRIAFFMHYLDPRVPLATPFGDVPLPSPTRRPSRLRAIEYEAP